MTITGETRTLTEALRGHYMPPAKPDAVEYLGGIFLTECGLNNGFGKQRFCDAVHVGFSSTSGRVLSGHEVKVSRADWLQELRHVDKASLWADACHQWWLVTPTPAIVKPGELPPGWGHMVPSRGRRFRIIEPAVRKADDHQPPWLVTRSIMSRLDTLQREELRQRRTEARRAAQEEAEQRVKAMAEDRLTPAARARLRTLDQLEERLGMKLSTWSSDPYFSVADLTTAIAIVQRWRSSGHRAGGRLEVLAKQALDTGEVLTHQAKALQQLADDLADFLTPAPGQGGGGPSGVDVR